MSRHVFVAITALTAAVIVIMLSKPDVIGLVNIGVLKISATVALPLCVPALQGRLAINVTAVNFSQIVEDHPEIEPGGMWRPFNCTPRHHIAIIIPYRNRLKHLQLLMRHLHPFLQRQLLDYTIYVIEQALPTTFNRAMLMNIGFVVSSNESDFSCYIFHDVDFLPEDDRNIYGCSEFPKHMAASINKHNYRLAYKRYVGGVTAIRPEHFRQINGFSNLYFGWGGEDDDLYKRITFANLTLVRNPLNIARYYTPRHGMDVGNEDNRRSARLLRRATLRMERDGLSSLKYKLIQIEKRPLYTWVYVNIHS